jgi:hypothetical protein
MYHGIDFSGTCYCNTNLPHNSATAAISRKSTHQRALMLVKRLYKKLPAALI